MTARYRRRDLETRRIDRGGGRSGRGAPTAGLRDRRHYPDQVDGTITIPTAPGSGVELDRDKLAFYHELFEKQPEVNELYEPNRPGWVPAPPMV